jgi:hypothetical protein
MKCVCGLPIFVPWEKAPDFVDHVCCYKDETFSCEHDHRAKKAEDEQPV